MLRLRPIAHVCFLLVTALALTDARAAQELLKENDPERAVRMFNMFCLSQLPDLEGVARAAGFGEFAQITGKELERYQPQVPAEELRAWRFHDHGAEYVLTAARAKPDAEFKKQAPEFAKSTSFACSLLIPAADPKEHILKSLAALLGRNPDETREQGSTRVYAWSGQADKLLIHVHYFAPASTKATGVLSASAFVRD